MGTALELGDWVVKGETLPFINRFSNKQRRKRKARPWVDLQHTHLHTGGENKTTHRQTENTFIY